MPFIKALKYLMKHYHIHHIQISGYNLHANGIVKHTHFNVRQALFKAANGDQAKWHQAIYSVFWADWVMICRQMGCSPYFAVTGTHPLLPFDITEAMYLHPPPNAPVSTTDLITQCTISLQKRQSDLTCIHSDVYAVHKQAATQFKCDHHVTIHNFNFPCSTLVLMRNTAIEKVLNHKMCMHYLGLLIVLPHNRGGAYILCELDGTVFDRPIAVFRIIPYFVHDSILLLPLRELVDIPLERLRE